MKVPGKVHANEITYELHTLGWRAFQDLCATIVSELLGQTIEIFLPSHDGGRDGAFHGSWRNDTQGGVKGSFTVQCKYSSKPTENLLKADLSDEISKAKRLAKRGLAKNYILMTNLGVSGTTEEKIRKMFLGIRGIRWFAVFGSNWITLRIHENPKLRMLVPRVYGLGDLSQILDERAYAQARDILASIGEDLAKFVITDAHRRSAQALLRHGFVLLLGEPASGKSIIAATLALGAIDVWNCSTLKILDAQAFVDHWNSHEPRQFFWVDDAFGTTQYQRDTVLAWNKTFPHLQAAIKKGARIVFTSRDYVFENAIQDIKVSAFPLIKESQVIINVQELTLEEKEQITYNHIKLGDQPRSFKTRIKSYLPQVAGSQKFLPEIARRLGSNLFTKKLWIDADVIKDFVEQPLDFLLEIVESLGTNLKAALALLFMRGGILESPLNLSQTEKTAVDRLGSSLSDIREALRVMNRSLVLFVSGSKNYWQFKHPSIADAIGEIISRDPELVDIYLFGTPPRKLIQEVTCGEAYIHGAKLSIPQNRYVVMMKSLDSIENQREIYTFLAYRCDCQFLKLYLDRHPTLLGQISSIGSYLSALAEVSLLVRLHELGLLPEEYRRGFVENVRDLAVETPDADFLSHEDIRAVFNSQEIDEILQDVKSKLLPNLDREIDNWRFNYDHSDDPKSYFDLLIDALKTFSNEFHENKEIQAEIHKALTNIDGEIERLLAEREEEDTEHYEELSSSSSSSSEDDKPRSIFDDVDE